MTLDRSAIHFMDVGPIPNRTSPFAHSDALGRAHGPGAYYDQYFGYSWDYDVAEGDAVYGLTGAIPPGPLEEQGNGRFIRTPYRRIPRITVSSQDELLTFARSVAPRMNSFTTLWRGQVEEYALPRKTPDKLKLYGDADIFEPSLLPSASRGKITFEVYMAAWFGLLELFIKMRLQLLQPVYEPSAVENLKEEVDVWYCSYRFKLWAFAVAQHYGLPSTGLDLTNSIAVALFFALHRFTIGPTGNAQISRATAADRPIIYAMGVHDNDLLPDADLAPPWLQASRPKAQDAFFFGTAWGNSSNRAAERIFAVLELQGHENWTVPEQRSQLFPSPAEDTLCHFLLEARTRYPELRGLVPLERVYSWP